MRASFLTLGCKLNQAETDELKRDLNKRGFLTVPFGKNEDIAIVRGCGVTCNASQTTRETIRQAKRKKAYVIAVGCVENKDLPEIDFAAKDNEEILAHLSFAKMDSDKICANSLIIRETDRTRAFIKIQTGCNFNCAYCVIPAFRGKSRSVPLNTIIEQINRAEKEGYKEAVLTGVNAGQYNFKIKRLKNYNTADLGYVLTQILAKSNIQRIRLGSLDPRLITKKLIDLYNNDTLPAGRQAIEQPARNAGGWGNGRLLPHWHLSLQSGSDSVLKRMNRLYTAKQYYAIVLKLRKANPLFSFTTDIIAGFPGETEEEFTQTCDFIKKVGFARVHVFPFSPRPGTAAAGMKNQVQDKIKTARVKRLISLSNKVGKKFASQFIGLKRPVLFESKKGDYWYGYTAEYLRVKLKSANKLRNRIIQMKLKKTLGMQKVIRLNQ